ncbi:MAG: small multi-drug export protein [Spirochaetales bacterium]|nr:small multi-drug export protein [Spirochaetales bacterium]
MDKNLAIFLVSMIPLIELRGSMIMAAGWQLPMLRSLVLCTLGNMIPVPFIYFFARKILEWGKDRKFIGPFAKFCLSRGDSAGSKLQEKTGRMGAFIALLLFVGIPLPGTGAWTGTLAASLLNLGFRKSVLAVLCGVILAGVIIGTLSSLGFAFLFGL